MRAVQLTSWQSDPVLADVPQPTAGPGQVVIKIAGAGLCHSDIHLAHEFPPGLMPWDPPFTLGHENSGYIHEVGEGVEGFAKGEAVAVFGPWGCGTCAACKRGQDTLCEAPLAGYKQAFGGGLGCDGGQAEYMLIPDPRFLVKIPDGVDPIGAAALTDAGLTPYHAIKLSLEKMTPTANVLVIGAGGLGHMAIQFLKVLTASTVIAIDTKPAARELAKEVGADHVLDAADPDVVAKVREITGGRGADVVIDFVGIDATLATAVACSMVQGDLTIVGVGGGSFKMGLMLVPYELHVTSIYWGTRGELKEILALAQKGLITPHYKTYAMEDAMQAYADMQSGSLAGRAVITP